MSCIQWSDALVLNQPRMDDTHREFVEHLQAVEAALEAPAEQWLARYDLMVQHTEAHFAQEEQWMAAMGFDMENCHARQHAGVLQALREVRAQLAQKADAEVARQLTVELAQWFTLHARSMDAALGQLIAETGFDPDSGEMRRGLQLTDSARHGCGNTSCL
jgi:hemerythrin-like metal-binding protein